MKPGKKPQPTVMRVLNGNLSRRPLNADEPKPKLPATLKSPVELDEHAKVFWSRYSEPLAGLGLLSEIDLDLLAMGAQWHSIHLRAVKELSYTLTQKTKANGKTARPEIAIAKQAFSVVQAVLSEFGVGPASRSRITGARDPAKPADPVEAFKRRKESMKLINGKKGGIE